ncbi:uncharacterized protein KLLA0_A10967g [Kluyveromyces lactis]|uniref:KLLA0A10967p n=1 Tax=Kluyveromyces lactis (strain ATCC 8585 / CBS 2359 / DSM 70799 / NBRC 1267 / NRRL Y-1140 / WM37) TaxID=284590 RepID=Q6CX62_KLULA|nr:uncharacterized protein KLLA0_A10967g [Kluyveromyces lactis]CAH03065.1 KLLA0A10967p [Kluyveromyces lactis]|eukprot:XP_451477.1 uncharacterized protein KLLA0_A10967g [Kluyveromyces lactis]
MSTPGHRLHHKHKHAHDLFPPENKQFMESRDFTGLDNPPEPKRTPNPFAEKNDSKEDSYVNALLSSVSQKLKNQQQHPSSTREQRHIFQQKSVPLSAEESPNSGDEIKFSNGYNEEERPDRVNREGKKKNGELGLGSLNGTEQAPAPPPPIRRNSSLYEDFKKAYYHDTHMFDSHK